MESGPSLEDELLARSTIMSTNKREVDEYGIHKFFTEHIGDHLQAQDFLYTNIFRIQSDGTNGACSFRNPCDSHVMKSYS
ncbi:hypothetical protein BWQ96_04047 [Gracilariopsis chorda]|uniref:Uncharacterized protein n=1 Tax=Gracilariopsis chorda TaxID=448386 RepID=A0A2V3IYG0_9FLOR|nr:hypothetical protein BWQ96_04047 [Gracilariopsis chorda]|eukprot:PXF46170.1 hypothetical protein BWQ96_04047 [Gracilariopsis chorda]